MISSTSTVFTKIYSKSPLLIKQVISFILSTVVLTALLIRGFLPTLTTNSPWSIVKHIYLTAKNSFTNPTLSMCVADYVKAEGFECEDFIVITEDGYELLLHHIFIKNADSQNKPPVLLMHGLLQSAGVFVTSGPNSLAFYLLQQGYDIWIGNNRGVRADKLSTPLCQAPNGQHLLGHASINPSDRQYWDWSIDDLGMFDFPALLSFVHERTQKKIHYVGHSQGNAQSLIALSSHPQREQLNSYLLSVTALAPAGSIGELVHKWPVCCLIKANRLRYLLLFGHLSFIPIMSYIQLYFPAQLFTVLAYQMFNFLFDWSDKKWDVKYKNAYFRFTPKPTSSRVVLQWTEVAKEGRLLPHKPDRHLAPAVRQRPSRERGERDGLVVVDGDSGYNKEYVLSNIHVPMIVFWGTEDKLVDAKDFLRQVKNVVVHEKSIEGYEHLDFIWAKNAREDCWSEMVHAWERVVAK